MKSPLEQLAELHSMVMSINKDLKELECEIECKRLVLLEEKKLKAAANA